MNRILIVGRARSSTGFGRVLRTIADGLASAFDVHVLALDVYRPETIDAWHLHPNASDFDPHAERTLPNVLAAVHPDVVLLFNDYWLIGALAAAVRRHLNAFIVAYIPVDAKILNPQSVAPLAAVDRLVLYCHWAKAEITRSASLLGLHTQPPFSDAEVIPHPTRTDLFYPLIPGERALSRLQARRKLGWTDADLDSFVVLNANKNARRKRIDITLNAFARFAENKPRTVRLYLHSGLREVGVDLRRCAASNGIEDRVMFTAASERHPDLAEQRLNLLYNACDIGVNTSIGEGWGLVSFEHACAGVPQVVPSHSACSELWQGSAELVEASPVRYGMMLEGAEVSPALVATSLERLYADVTHRAQLAAAATANALRSEFTPASVSSEWRTLIAQDISHAVH